MFIPKKTIEPIDFEGLSITDYTAAEELSSSCASIRVSPGVSHRKAFSRRSDKYYLVVSGTIDFTLEEETKAMNSGDFCFVPQGTLFSYSNPYSSEAEIILFHTPSFDIEEEVFLDH